MAPRPRDTRQLISTVHVGTVVPGMDAAGNGLDGRGRPFLTADDVAGVAGAAGDATAAAQQAASTASSAATTASSAATTAARAETTATRAAVDASTASSTAAAAAATATSAQQTATSANATAASAAAAATVAQQLAAAAVAAAPQPRALTTTVTAPSSSALVDLFTWTAVPVGRYLLDGHLLYKGLALDQGPRYTLACPAGTTVAGILTVGTSSSSKVDTVVSSPVFGMSAASLGVSALAIGASLPTDVAVVITVATAGTLALRVAPSGNLAAVLYPGSVATLTRI